MTVKKPKNELMAALKKAQADGGQIILICDNKKSGFHCYSQNLMLFTEVFGLLEYAKMTLYVWAQEKIKEVTEGR